MKLKHYIFIIFILFFSNNQLLNSQEKILKTMVVKSVHGLRMRSGPDLKSKKLLVIPNNAIIHIYEISNKKESISNIKGRWIKTKWNNTTGWVFNGFLKIPDWWINEIFSFWLFQDKTDGIIFDSIGSGGGGSLYGCPGGSGAFKIVESYLIKNKIKFKAHHVELYVDFKTYYTSEIEYVSKNVILINKNKYNKSDYSECNAEELHSE